jgi:hypothetical protein
MSAQKVKGTMLLDFVKMVRKHRHLNWNKYLEPQDWEVVDAKILPGVWYPAGVYIRCSIAAFYLLGKGNLEAARANGRMIAGRMFENTYKSLTQIKDPAKGLNQFLLIFSSLFNLTLLTPEAIEPRHARLAHVNNFDSPAAISTSAAFAYQLLGFLESVVEVTGGRRVKGSVVSKQWEGAPATILDITWE